MTLCYKAFLFDAGIITLYRFSDQATFEQPHQYAIGFEYVMENGKLMISKGQSTGAMAGKAIRN